MLLPHAVSEEPPQHNNKLCEKPSGNFLNRCDIVRQIVMDEHYSNTHTLMSLIAHLLDQPQINHNTHQVTFVQCNLPHSIEAIVTAVNREDWRSRISFCHTTISLKDDHFCPNFVINLSPLIQHFLNVLL